MFSSSLACLLLLPMLRPRQPKIFSWHVINRSCDKSADCCESDKTRTLETPSVLISLVCGVAYDEKSVQKSSHSKVSPSEAESHPTGQSWSPKMQ
jgi:hypothetical protein